MSALLLPQHAGGPLNSYFASAIVPNLMLCDVRSISKLPPEDGRLSSYFRRASLTSLLRPLNTDYLGKLLTVHPVQIHRWIKMLIADGLLVEIKRGGQYRATRYRWKFFQP